MFHLSRTCITILTAVFTAAPLFAANPVLDLAAQGSGAIVDRSKFHRSLKGSGDGTSLLSKPDAVAIPFAQKDPLFGVGATTWILRCKFAQPNYPSAYTIAGRWNYAGNQRVISLSVIPNKTTARFQISKDGGASSTLGCAQTLALPSAQWITIVARFDPEKELTAQLYDDTGKMVDNRTVRKDVSKTLFGSPAAFTVGAPPAVMMELSRLQVFDSALSDQEVAAAVTAAAVPDKR